MYCCMKNIVVIKVGSSVIFTKRRKLDEYRLNHLAQQMRQIRNNGIGALLVISGAVAMGSYIAKRTGLISTNTSDRGYLYYKKMLAGIGQASLISKISDIFKKKNLMIAQILITNICLKNISLREDLRRNLLICIESGIIPVINENDVLELNSFGGNDYLAGEIAKLLKCRKLLMLSTMEGSAFGVGGGRAKMEVRKYLAKYHIGMEIVDGKARDIIRINVLKH